MSLLCCFHLQSRNYKKPMPDLLIQINFKHTTFGSMDSTAILSQQYFKVRPPAELRQSSQFSVSPKCDHLLLDLLQLVRGRNAVRALWCFTLPGYTDCSLLGSGSGRGGRELLPSQYMDIGDGALVPEMCERGIHWVPAMHEAEEHTVLKYPFTGSKLLEQNYS